MIVNRRSLLVWCGISAWIGAFLWGYKGVAILATGDQPDHVFQIAPFFFGISIIALLYGLIGDLRRPKWLLATLAWLAVSAGAVAAVSNFAGKEDDFGDLGYLVNFVSTITLLFLISRDIRRQHLLPRWSFTPTLLAWSLFWVIPVGAILEGIDERLLEIPLVATAGVWMVLGIAVLSRDVPPRNSYPS